MPIVVVAIRWYCTLWAQKDFFPLAAMQKQTPRARLSGHQQFPKWSDMVAFNVYFHVIYFFPIKKNYLAQKLLLLKIR